MAQEAGFDLAAPVAAAPSPCAGNLDAWLDAGCHADMECMKRTRDRRVDPRIAWPETSSFLVVGLSYFTEVPSPAVWDDPERGRIARFAWGPDYHDVIGSRLRHLSEAIRRTAGLARAPRFFVDTSAVMERDLAERAGLGFIGRNAQWISLEYGSYVHPAGVALPWTVEAPPPVPVPPRDGCGACRRCLDACPTGALRAPYVCDARRCLSWLTLESRGAIPSDLQPRMSRWIAGCDACQEPCPWTRVRSRPARVPYLEFISDAHAPRLRDVLEWGESAFLERYRGTVLHRVGLTRLQRNVSAILGLE